MNIFTVLLIQPLANGLILFYRLLGNNMGLAIIGFSLALVLALRPLTSQYMESMKKMKEFAPQLDKLKKKYKDDKTGLMKAQSDFYKEKGINPGAGCLPMILQLVVLFGLLQVFLQALGGSDPTKLNALLYAPLKFGAHELINTRFLYLNIAKPDTFHIPGIPFGIPGIVLILAAISQMISAKIAAPYIEAEEKMVKKTQGSADDFAAAMQSSAIYTFPLMTLLVGGNFPSGVALYWVTFSIYQAFQQYKSTGLGGLKSWINKAKKLLGR
jgi:YidC/Oxa1 family membrane protein insertase